MVGWLALSTIGVLLLFTASVLIPFKAILLSLLSLAATFGGRSGSSRTAGSPG